jgi:uncharacterized membrane protein YbhN (UPF0104 family)
VNDAPARKAHPSRPKGRSILRRLSGIPTPVIFIVSVLLALAALWVQGSLRDVAAVARDADLGLLIGAGLLYLVSLALLAARWHLLVKMIHGTSHAMRAAEAFLTSVVINYAAPVGLAVPSRAALTKRALGLTTSETGKIALWEVGADVIVLALLSLVWIAVSGSKGIDAISDAASPLLVVAVVVAGLLALGLLLVLVRRMRPALWARLRLEGREFARLPIEKPLHALRVTVASLVYWAMQIAVLWLLLRAVDVDPSVSLTLGLVSLPILIGMVSPVPGGAGVREALMVAMAHVYDADSTAVLLAALVYRVALFAAIPVLYAGVRLWLRREHLEPTVHMHDLAHDESDTKQTEEPA